MCYKLLKRSVDLRGTAELGENYINALFGESLSLHVLHVCLKTKKPAFFRVTHRCFPHRALQMSPLKCLEELTLSNPARHFEQRQTA